MKHSSVGQYEMSMPFSVLPNDSTLARRVGFREDASPIDWFTDFVIFPTDSVVFNDPKNASNWIKSVDSKGNPVYTFTLAE